MINAIYTLMLSELVIGGGGRVFSIGPITLRILLFFIAIISWSVTALKGGRESGQGLAWLIIGAYFFAHFPVLFFDLISLQVEQPVSLELRGLVFVLSAPFIAMSLSCLEMVGRSILIFIYGGLLVSIAITSVYILGGLGFLDFLSVYKWGVRTGELFFRSSQQFFFKGHFYVGIALIFVVIVKPKFWLLISCLLCFCVIASLTRGLVFAVTAAIFFGLIYTRDTRSMSLISLIGIVLAIFYSQEILSYFSGGVEREDSLRGRSNDFQEFASILNLEILLTGEGFGALLNGRQSVENTFIWAIWRLGILGFLFWMAPIFICLYYFVKIGRTSPHRNAAGAIFSGMIMLFIVTNFNPFINNSIGTLYALVAIFSLRRLALNQSSTLPLRQRVNYGPDS